MAKWLCHSCNKRIDEFKEPPEGFSVPNRYTVCKDCVNGNKIKVFKKHSFRYKEKPSEYKNDVAKGYYDAPVDC